MRLMFCPQIKLELFIRLLVDQTCYHLAVQKHGRRGTEAKDMEMDQGFGVDTFCFELTDINLSSLLVSTLYLTWPRYPLGFLYYMIKDLSAYKN